MHLAARALVLQQYFDVCKQHKVHRFLPHTAAVLLDMFGDGELFGLSLQTLSAACLFVAQKYNSSSLTMAIPVSVFKEFGATVEELLKAERTVYQQLLLQSPPHLNPECDLKKVMVLENVQDVVFDEIERFFDDSLFISCKTPSSRLPPVPRSVHRLSGVRAQRTRVKLLPTLRTGTSSPTLRARASVLATRVARQQCTVEACSDLAVRECCAHLLSCRGDLVGRFAMLARVQANMPLHHGSKDCRDQAGCQTGPLFDRATRDAADAVQRVGHSDTANGRRGNFHRSSATPAEHRTARQNSKRHERPVSEWHRPKRRAVVANANKD